MMVLFMDIQAHAYIHKAIISFSPSLANIQFFLNMDREKNWLDKKHYLSTDTQVPNQYLAGA